MKINDQEQDLKEILGKYTCRGCYNHCSLDNPGCGKSRIWINEVIKKIESKED